MGRRFAIFTVLLLAAPIATTNTHLPFPWIPTDPDADALFPFWQGNNVGYIDATGKIVIAPTRPGQPENHFSKPRPVVERRQRLLSDARFEQIETFHDGLALVRVKGEPVYSESCGEIALPNPKWYRSRCRYTFVDESGQVLGQHFEEAASFSEGLAMVFVVRKGSMDESAQSARAGFIDKTGRLAIPPQFLLARSFSEGVALVDVSVGKNVEHGFIDHAGKFVLGPTTDELWDFHDGRALAMTPYRTDDHHNFYYIGRTGLPAFEGRFVIGSDFFKGVAHVKLDGEMFGGRGRFAYIDTHGRRIFTYTR